MFCIHSLTVCLSCWMGGGGGLDFVATWGRFMNYDNQSNECRV